MCSDLDAFVIDRKFSNERQTGAAVESFRNETVKVSQLLKQPPKQINTINPSITP